MTIYHGPWWCPWCGRERVRPQERCSQCNEPHCSITANMFPLRPFTLHFANLYEDGGDYLRAMHSVFLGRDPCWPDTQPEALVDPSPCCPDWESPEIKAPRPTNW